MHTGPCHSREGGNPVNAHGNGGSDDDDYRVRPTPTAVSDARLQYGPAASALAYSIWLRWIATLSPTPFHQLDGDQHGNRREDGGCDDYVHGEHSGQSLASLEGVCQVGSATRSGLAAR